MRAKQIMGMFVVMAVLACGTMASAQDVTTLPIKEEQQLYEIMAEFINNGPANHQFGYLGDVAGLSSVFSSTTTKDESTALFTYVVDAQNFQVVTHGAFRITDRVGTCTIYLNNGPSDFNNPASFSQGTPIQVSTYRQTVVVRLADNTFVSTNTHTITKVETFSLNGVNYRLGQIGKSFRSTYSGVVGLNQPPLVTGFFAGTAVGMK
jgi:hypothetical protein